MLWMCSKWLNFRIKKLHFRIRKKKMITTIHKICKKEQHQQHQKGKKEKEKERNKNVDG